MSSMIDSPEDNPDGINPSLEGVDEDLRDEDTIQQAHANLEVELEAEATFAEIIAQMSLEFDQRTEARHQMGAEKYGPGKFLMVDTIEEALDEIVDLANYARYTFIKLRLLQEAILQRTPPSGFISTKDFTAFQEG